MTIPEVSEITGEAKDAIEAATLITDAEIEVVLDDGKQDKAIERQLRRKGAVVVVAPLLGGTLRDQAGNDWIMDCRIMIRVHINPEKNADTEDGGAGVDIYDMVRAVVDACTRRARHPGGEFLKLARDAFTLSQFDPGLWTYDIQFTKEAML